MSSHRYPHVSAFVKEWMLNEQFHKYDEIVESVTIQLITSIVNHKESLECAIISCTPFPTLINDQFAAPFRIPLERAIAEDNVEAQLQEALIKDHILKPFDI